MAFMEALTSVHAGQAGWEFLLVNTPLPLPWLPRRLLYTSTQLQTDAIATWRAMGQLACAVAEA